MTYPLAVSANRRYLVDGAGKPLLVVGDSPQALIANLSERQAALYFANRRAAGFNSVWINLLCNRYTAGRPDGSTYDGLVPFTTPGDLSSPNEAYFTRVDRMLRLAGRYGLTVFLDPIETGGWLSTLLQNGVKRDYDYGRYLGERYASFPNIVWLNGNDFQDWRHPEVDAVALAVARGIRSRDRTHLQTVELDSPVSGSLDDDAWRSLIQIDLAYSYRPTYAVIAREYARRGARPTLLLEANYEYEYSYANPQTLRRQEYWTMLSGAAGQFYGNKFTWQFLKGWERRLDTSGSVQLGYLTRLLAGRPWYDLVPDLDHRVITAGYGTFTAKGSVNASDYVTTARTRDGRLVIAYLPTARSVSVDMRRLAGPVRAQWYDPTTGRYAPGALSGLSNSGTRSFAPPPKKAAGGSDWVLVLTAGS